MLHHLLLTVASWFKSEESAAAADIKDKDWASPHTLLVLAFVAYLLWITHLALTGDHIRWIAIVLAVYLPCHALMYSVTKVCQAWGPNCRTTPSAPPAAAPGAPGALGAPLVTTKTT